MNVSEAIENIKKAIHQAPRNNYTVELHVQMIKYADLFEDLTGREFCEILGLSPPWAIEFNKMRKISTRLQNAGLDLDKI